MESACRIYRPRDPRKTALWGLLDTLYDFLHHRELLGKLSPAAAQAAKELLAAAAMEEKGFRPGVVSVVQTFGDRANFHPHVQALITRGGWTGSGERARSVAKMLAGLVAHQLANGGLLDLTTAAWIG